MKIRNKSALIISILIPLAVGSMSALFSGNMLSYSILDKPAFSPPGFIFPIVWTIIFFGLDLYLFAFIWLIALIFIIIIMIRQFYIVSPLAAYLQIPYLIWCIFAAYLNFSIFILN